VDFDAHVDQPYLLKQYGFVVIRRLRVKQVSTAGGAAGAIAVRICAAQGAFDDGCDASNPRPHFNGSVRAVSLTGAAFHARIPVSDSGLAVPNAKNGVRTNRGAHAATVALRFVQPQGHNAGKIAKVRCHHFLDNILK
jgi:hypothetical protein